MNKSYIRLLIKLIHDMSEMKFPKANAMARQVSKEAREKTLPVFKAALIEISNSDLPLPEKEKQIDRVFNRLVTFLDTNAAFPDEFPV